MHLAEQVKRLSAAHQWTPDQLVDSAIAILTLGYFAVGFWDETQTTAWWFALPLLCVVLFRVVLARWVPGLLVTRGAWVAHLIALNLVWPNEIGHCFTLLGLGLLLVYTSWKTVAWAGVVLCGAELVHRFSAASDYPDNMHVLWIGVTLLLIPVASLLKDISQASHDLDVILNAIEKEQRLPGSFVDVKCKSYSGRQLRENVLRIAQFCEGLRGHFYQMHLLAAELSQRSRDAFSQGKQSGHQLFDLTTCLDQINLMVTNHASMSLVVRDGAVSASQVAQRGESNVANLVESMQKIEASTAQIQSFAESIESIAFHSNLLALNASIEASHAGDVGRGFCVVAEQTRVLAKSVEHSTRAIKKLLSDSTSTVRGGVVQSKNTGVVMTELVQTVEQVQIAFDQLAQDNQDHVAVASSVTGAVLEIQVGMQQGLHALDQVNQFATSLLAQTEQVMQLEKAFLSANPALEQ